MDLRRLGDSMLRYKSSPLLSFLAPAVPQAWLFGPNVLRVSLNSTKRENAIISPFCTTTRRRAGSYSSSGADQDFPKESSSSPRSNRESAPAFSADTDARAAIDSLLNGIIPNPRSGNSDQSSATDIRGAFRESRETIKTRESRRPGGFASMMEFPPTPGVSRSMNPNAKVIQDLNGLRTLNPRNKRTIRSRPSVGRTVELDPARGLDFGRALRKMNILCATNKVRADLMHQKFHERAGMKRKRLKNERWRKLFRDGFRATVGRVKEMRRKGW